MNRIKELFQHKKSQILNIYFTAGFPRRDDTCTILEALDQAGVDLVEIGIPYSDPVADGETIQDANQLALAQGMSLKVLFDQLAEIRRQGIRVPIVLMGYFNPVYQYGVDNFCKKCAEVGVDGLILPDLPVEEYDLNYKKYFQAYDLLNIFLITPQTSDERIHYIDKMSEGFLYMVSSASVTGKTSRISTEQINYFDRVNKLNLKNPRLIGFGIKDKHSFEEACNHAQGAIIGSQFIRILKQSKDAELKSDIHIFVRSIRGVEKLLINI